MGPNMTPAGRWHFMFIFFAEPYFQMKCVKTMEVKTNSSNLLPLSLQVLLNLIRTEIMSTPEKKNILTLNPPTFFYTILLKI